MFKFSAYNTALKTQAFPRPGEGPREGDASREGGSEAAASHGPGHCAEEAPTCSLRTSPLSGAYPQSRVGALPD